MNWESKSSCHCELRWFFVIVGLINANESCSRDGVLPVLQISFFGEPRKQPETSNEKRTGNETRHHI